MLELRLSIMEWMERLDMDPSFADRYLNEGFSGGEKKRNEILQMAILEPELAILDETDSGLDIDALRVVAKGVHEVRAARPELGMLVITHYQRLLDELTPDRRAHPRRRPHRRHRRPGAGRPARGARATTHGADRDRAPSPIDDLDVAAIKADFPLLAGAGSTASRLVYLDSAASSQKPQPVLDAMDHYYETTNANVHRGVYAIAEEATNALEAARSQGRPVHRRAVDPDEIVFTKNATEALNLVAHSLGPAPTSPPATPSLLTEIEHHANIVPWQHARRRAGHRAPLDPAQPPTAAST